MIILVLDEITAIYLIFVAEGGIRFKRVSQYSVGNIVRGKKRTTVSTKKWKQFQILHKHMGHSRSKVTLNRLPP